MANIAWPDGLKPVSFGFSLIDFDRSGGAGLGGNEQWVFSPGARWSAKMRLQIVDDAGVLTVRALRAKLKGKANAAILPNFDGRRASWPIEAATGRVITPRVGKLLTGTLGLEGTTYEGPDIPTPSQVLATVQTDAALHATTIEINLTQGGPLLEGQQFSIAGQIRMYEIATIDSVAGSVTTVSFQPPLRTAVTAGAAVNFTRPTCLMRCMNLDEQSGQFESFTFATLNLEFVEFL
jgi:hypothetical protein